MLTRYVPLSLAALDSSQASGGAKLRVSLTGDFAVISLDPDELLQYESWAWTLWIQVSPAAVRLRRLARPRA